MDKTDSCGFSSLVNYYYFVAAAEYAASIFDCFDCALSEVLFNGWIAIHNLSHYLALFSSDDSRLGDDNRSADWFGGLRLHI